MLHTFFYFMLALIILIVIHEFGHFIVARACGVKVLRFSFGFGKVIARWQGKKGTEYAWSLFPLGGYVKMLDESEGEVAEHEKHLAFNNQSLLYRFLIVIAGPLFNFLFAFFALWLMWVIGFKSLAPIVDHVEKGSIAAEAGLQANQEILSLNQTPVNSWRDFQYAILPLIGGDEPLTMITRGLDGGSKNKVEIPIEDWMFKPNQPDLLKSMGITPFIPKIPPVIGEVVKNTPADKAGLLKGDRIISINEKPIKDWLDVVQYVRERPGQSILLKVKRGSALVSKPLNIGVTESSGEKQGILGVKSEKVDWPAKWLRKHHKGPFDAATASAKQTLDLTVTTFAMIGRLITGKIPIETLSGPVGIAQGAGESARGGIAYYLSFLALVSISLGVLNLLPIPLLDGGHLLFYAIELVRRKPLSEEAKSTGMYVGLVFLMGMMIIALSNDIVRLSG